MTPRAAVLLFVVFVSAHADTLTLRNGPPVTGTWLGIDAAQIKFQVNDQIRIYLRSDVLGGTFGDVAPPPGTAQASGGSGSVQEPERKGAVRSEDPAGKSTLAEPEYVGDFFLLDSTAALKPFERQTGQLDAKLKAFGLGGVTEAFFVPGSHSPVRVTEGTDVSAIVRLASREINPVSIVQLFRFKVRNNRRELPISGGGYGDSAVPFEFVKYGEKSFKIKPKGDLPPGEYVFGLNTSQDGYCFGIDPK
jgi:hypothetical protein